MLLNYHNLRLLSLVSTFLILFAPTNSNGEDQYTVKERGLLPKLRKRVSLNLTQDIMTEDKYLVRFLRAQDHDIVATEKMIRQNLEWRAENKIDSILKEDWSYWMTRIPFMDHITDYEGRPTLTAGLAGADARKFLLGGQGQQMLRYATYAIERSVHTLHKVSNRTGKEYTSGYMLIDLAGYNIRIHGCPACVLLWFELLKIYENYYPRLALNVIIVNAPRFVPHTYQLLKPIMTSYTAESLKVYDFDKGAWKKELFKIFPEDILTLEFGGKGPTIYAQPL